MVISLILLRPCSALSMAQEPRPRRQAWTRFTRGVDLPRPAYVAQDEGIPCIKEKGRALPLEANFGMDMTQSVPSIAEDFYRQVAAPHGLDPLYTCGDVFVVLFTPSRPVR